MKKNLKINRGEENTKKKIGNSYLQNIGRFKISATAKSDLSRKVARTFYPA